MVQFKLNPKQLYGFNNAAINNPVENKLIELKIGKNNCIVSTAFNNEHKLIQSLINKNDSAPKNSWESVVNCILGDGIPEKITKEGLNMMFTSGNPAIKSALWMVGLNGEELLFRTFPKVESVETKVFSEFGGSNSFC